jgi:hypothetical protein
MNAARAPTTPAADVLLLPHWSEQDWRGVLDRTTLRRVAASEIIIARGTEERNLYFTLAGEFEVGGAYMGSFGPTPRARC